MKDQIGRIYGLLVYRGEGGVKQSGMFPLTVKETILATPTDEIDRRIIFKINSLPSDITEECISAAKNSILTCQNLLKNDTIRLNSFKKRQFTINIETHNPNEWIAIEGRSHELAIAICVLSSFLRIPIEQNVAVTGCLDQNNGKILYVESIIDKLRPFVEQTNKNEVSRFILPNLLILDQLSGSDELNQTGVERVYNYLTRLDRRKLSNKKQSIILCDTLLEAIIFITPENKFNRTVLSLRYLFFRALPKLIFNKDFDSEIKDRIIGSSNIIKNDLEQKRKLLIPSQERKQKATADSKRRFHNNIETFGLYLLALSLIIVPWTPFFEGIFISDFSEIVVKVASSISGVGLLILTLIFSD